MRLSVMVAPLDSGAAALFSSFDGVIFFDRHGLVVRSVQLPVVRRRGSPTDAEARARASRSPEDLYSILSTAAHLQRLADGSFAAMHFDFTLVGQRLTAEGFVTVLKADLSAACVDGVIPFSSDAQPAVDFRGDTLFVLDQFVTEADGVLSVVRGWTCRSGTGCRCRRERHTLVRVRCGGRADERRLTGRWTVVSGCSTSRASVTKERR